MAPTAPHPMLPQYVQSASERQRFVKNLFDSSAVHYDRICCVMSFGCGQAYRRVALERAGVKHGMRVLDVATGTGLVAQEALALVGAAGRVIGVDPSGGMLRESLRVGHRLVQGLGEALPFRTSHFDFVTMGYGLRHLADLDAAFADYLRVLKPDGRIIILEFTRPNSRLGLWLTRQYFRHAVPLMARLVTRSADSEVLMNYCWDTIAGCVEPATILASLKSSGFFDIERRVISGVFGEYTARKRRPLSAVG